MENDQAPVYYDVPADIESFTSEQAGSTLNKIYAQAGADKKHPYSNPVHPQSKEFRTAVTRLHKIKCGPEPEPQTNAEGDELVQSSQFPPAMVKAMGEALSEKAGHDEAVQEKLRADIEIEVNEINSILPLADLDVNECVETATPESLEGYKMMRLLGQGDYNSLRPLLIKDARTLGMSAADISQIDLFMSAAVPGDQLSDEITDVLIRNIYNAKKRLANRGQ